MHSSRQGSLQAWLVCLSAGLFFFYEFIQMSVMNVLAEPLLNEFAENALDISKLSSIHLYSDALFLIPAGLILDNFSTRKTLITTFLITIFGVALLGFANSMWVASLSRFITGFGNAFCFLISLRLIAYWFEPKQLALVSGIVVTIAMFGGVLAQTPAEILIEIVGGWRQAMFINAGIGLIFLVTAIIFVVDYVPGNKQTKTGTTWKSMANSLKLAGTNTQNWFAGIYTCLLNLPIMLLGALWGKAFLVSTRELSEIHALNITAMIFVGTIIGSPLLGWLSDRLMRRRMPMIICGIISLIILLAITYIPNLSHFQLYTLFFLLGFITSAQVISYPLITEHNSLQLNSSAMAIASIIIMGGAGFIQNLSSWIIDKSNNLDLVHPYYYAMIFLIGCFAVAILVSFFLKETYCRHQEPS